MYKELDHYTDALRTYLTSTYHISHPTLVDRAIALKLRALQDLEQVVMIPTRDKAFGLHAAFEGLVFLE